MSNVPIPRQRAKRKKWLAKVGKTESHLKKLVEEFTPRIPKENLALEFDVEPTLLAKFWRLANAVLSDWSLVPREGGENEFILVKEFLTRWKDKRTQLHLALQDAFSFGDGWIFLQENEAGDAYIGGLRIDPLKIDVKRDDLGKPIVDDKGQPTALQLLPPGVLEKIDVPLDDFAHFRFFVVNTDPTGKGLLDPLYNIITIKANTETSLGESIDTAAHRPMIIKVGNETNVDFTAQTVGSLFRTFIAPHKMNRAVIPWYVDVAFTEPPPIADISSSLNYFENLVNESLFFPTSVLTARGRRVGALESVSTDWEEVIAGLRDNFAEQLEIQVFERVVKKAGGDPKKTPMVEFKAKNAALLLSKARRLGIYVRNGLITPSLELENELRKAEGLPELKAEEWKPPVLKGKGVESLREGKPSNSKEGS